MKFLGGICIAIANRKHGRSSISRSKSVSSSSANFRLSHSTEIIRDPTAGSSPCSNKDHQPSPFWDDIFIKVHIGFMPFQKGSNTPSIGMHIFTSFVVVENGRKELPERITRCWDDKSMHSRLVTTIAHHTIYSHLNDCLSLPLSCWEVSCHFYCSCCCGTY
jgi:hypothetical protein